jgi:GntR family transcriptional regulator, galactonate operon transcriptional repressor
MRGILARTYLEEENHQLKQTVAELLWDRKALKAVNSGILSMTSGDRGTPTLRDNITRVIAFLVLQDKRDGSNRILGSEVGLAKQFKVSRTVLREAVKVLQGKGMVEVRPKTGILIRPRCEWSLLDADLISWQCALGLDEPFVRNLTRLRLILEPAAAQSAAVDGTDEEIRTIYDWHLKHVVDTNDIDACVDADIGFHRSIALATHNDLLIHVTQNVLNAIRASIVYKNPRIAQMFAFQLHREVAESILKRDGQGAHAAMCRLVNQAEKDLIDRLKAGAEAGLDEESSGVAHILRQMTTRRGGEGILPALRG